MNNKQTVVFYHGGFYGTYVRWLCESLFTNVELSSPLTTAGPTIGNSHSFINTCAITCMYKNIDEFKINLSKTDCAFIFVHPKNRKDQSVAQAIDFVAQKGYPCIFLYPDQKFKLFACNNWYQKVKNNWWAWQSSENNIDSKLYQNWPVEKNTALLDIPDWIKREFLSFYLLPAWEDQVEWYFPDNYQKINCNFINFSTLFDQTQELIDLLQKFSNLKLTKSFVDLLPYHKQMLSLQKNKNQDLIYNNIIDTLQNNSFFEWQPNDLTLVTEACIQYYLRNIGIELKCNGLNKFPTNTNDLKRIFC